MASICTRCALRLRRAAAIDSAPLSRPFTSTTTRHAHAVPKFSETSNAELDDVLANMRNKHFIPAALTPAQRRLIFGHSKREDLLKYPQTVDVAGEQVDLKWIDRRKEIPKRTKLFHQAIKLMAQDGSDEAWRNLFELLTGLKRSGAEIDKMETERIIRVAADKGHLGAIFACLHKGTETGLILTKPEVLEGVLLALRKTAKADDWSQESTQRAMAFGRDLAQLLEMKMHGGGAYIKPNDLRRDPRVIGLFLELSAVFAEKHQSAKDADGRVKAYAERLLYNMGYAKEITSTEPVEKGPQIDMLLRISIYHGLTLAQRILAMDMPNAMLAEEVRGNYERGLTTLTEQLERQSPNRAQGGYADQTLTAWRGVKKGLMER